MRADDSAGVRTDFVINDQVNRYPTRTVETSVSRDELDLLVRSGYLVRRGLLDAEMAGRLAAAVLRPARAEKDRGL